MRAGAAPALREFVRATGIPVAETFMGKGLLPPDNPKALGSVGLQSGDYMMAGFDEADVVLAIGYDLVEHSPEHWNPGRDKKIICIDSVPAEIDAYFMPEVELVGDIYHVLARLGEECRHVPHHGGSNKLREVVLGRFEQAKDDDAFPVQPPRALFEIRKALGEEQISYLNNSPDTLREMYVHQYLNAFRPASAWSRADQREGRVRFQSLREPDYGYERFTTPPAVRPNSADAPFVMTVNSLIDS